MQLLRQNDLNLTKKNVQLQQVKDVAMKNILPHLVKVQLLSGPSEVKEEAAQIAKLINEMFATGAV